MARIPFGSEAGAEYTLDVWGAQLAEAEARHARALAYYHSLDLDDDARDAAGQAVDDASDAIGELEGLIVELSTALWYARGDWRRAA